MAHRCAALSAFRLGRVHSSNERFLRPFLKRSSRRFADPALQSQSCTTLTPGVLGGLEFRVSRSARTHVHHLVEDVDETRSLGAADFGLSLDRTLGVTTSPRRSRRLRDHRRA
jgi:hypothetical protein